MSIPRLNATWHRAHPMPLHPTFDERVRWHRAHARSCSCRTMPKDIKAEIARRNRTKALTTRNVSR